MSERIRIILIIWSCFLIIAGCSSKDVPNAYHYSALKSQWMITGNWTKISIIERETEIPNEYSGELIAVDLRKLYILSDSGIISFRTSEINSAVIYIFRSPKQHLLGYVSLIPNFIGALESPEHAQYFVFMGLPLLVTSITLHVMNSHSRAKIKYPEDVTINDIAKYARFPAGLPTDLDLSALHLKKTK